MSLLPRLALALPLLAPAALGQEPDPRTEPADQKDSRADFPDLKDEIDLSIRWLRSVQDPKTGAYGEGVEPTAWVLRALAESPRHYRRQDGPLVGRSLQYMMARQAEDGSIADEGADAGARLESTRVAAAALAAHLDQTTRDAAARALRHLADAGVSDPNAGLGPRARDADEAERRAVALLARRAPDGSWDGAAGRVTATAQAVLELSHAHALTKKPEVAPAGAKPLPAFRAASPAEVDAAILRGAEFLLKVAEDGKWGAPGQPDAGLTAMVLGSLQAVPRPRPEAVQRTIDAGLEWLAGLQRADGSIHQGRLANYVTSSAVLALAGAQDERWKPVIARARAYLVDLQADEGEGYSEGDLYYGGIGYGGDERPDLSNLQMALEALEASGLEKDHEAWRRALTFLQRCQNRSESNDIELATGDVVIRAGDDGGAGYAPGDSKAGFVELEGGQRVPRSYGSMTYALLKSFVFAGLRKDDPRVQACWKWLQENYTLDVNPGMEHSPDPTAAYQGLYYYFHSMARALDVFGAEEITGPDGVSHAWRPELAGRILAMQSPIDGSWVNANAPRWWEGNPVLATAYALLTLDATRKR